MQPLTPSQALQKIKTYCAYQERSHQEVKDKLYGFGLYKKDVEPIMAELIEENYLNEERFAQMFVGGKFRIKQWGRIKIINELKQKKVSPYNIKIALREIDEPTYLQTLEKMALKKWESLRADQYIVREEKTTKYLMQKGYEINLIREVLQKIRSKK
ncbi:regulatory protein RecX [Arachidicoccus sp.]|jgi:regulatory protein|uniref:regulatory protein RecX n=1 Tax=Arachidicoccus sp. TaxID=1872624 RepID=UPI003D1EF877